MQFKILGCGSSMGVPRADGDFGKCNPNEKKNYSFVNGNKIEERYLDEEDWENGWSHV